MEVLSGWRGKWCGWRYCRVTRSMTLKRRTLGSKKEDNPKMLLGRGRGGGISMKLRQ